MTSILHAELQCRADSATEFARLAGQWLTQSWPEVLPEFASGLAEEPALTGPDEHHPNAPWGPPGAVYGEFLVRRKPVPSQGRHARYSAQAWRQVLARLESQYPLDVELWLTPLGDDGLPRERDEYGLDAAGPITIAVRRRPECPEWVQCVLGTPTAYLPFYGSPAVQRQWVDFLRAWAIRLDVCYGHLTDDADSWFGTALERATAAQLEETMPRCRTMLRGYSWVTICAAELVRRLGGVAALSPSGAFHEVVELPGGQVLLKATELLEQYEGAAVTRVFEALAPVLLPGRTLPEAAHPGMRLVIGVDAADYR